MSIGPYEKARQADKDGDLSEGDTMDLAIRKFVGRLSDNLDCGPVEAAARGADAMATLAENPGLVDEINQRSQKNAARLKGERDDKRGSKADVARRASRNLLLGRANEAKQTRATSGAAVKVGDVTDHAQALGVSLQNTQVYRAWDDLAEEWDALRVRKKNGRKTLVADVDEIPDALWDAHGDV